MSCFDSSAEDKWKARSIPDYDEERMACPWCGNIIGDAQAYTEIGDDCYHDDCVAEMDEDDYLGDKEDEE